MGTIATRTCLLSMEVSNKTLVWNYTSKEHALRACHNDMGSSASRMTWTNNAATGDQFFQFSDLVSTAERINVNVEIKHSWVKGVSAMSCDVVC